MTQAKEILLDPRCFNHHKDDSGHVTCSHCGKRLRRGSKIVTRQTGRLKLKRVVYCKACAKDLNIL